MTVAYTRSPTTHPTSCVAFQGTKRIAQGDLRSVTTKVKRLLERDPKTQVLLFNADSGHYVEFDFRGTLSDVQERANALVLESESAAPADNRKRGRPKLGVVAGEITLLPRHWAWLKSQPGGASVTLRRLIENARKGNQQEDRLREAQDTIYRFMSVIAGDLPGFEEATRALYGGQADQFREHLRRWPAGIRSQCHEYGRDVFPSKPSGTEN